MTDTLETTGCVTVAQVRVPVRDGLTLAGTLHRAPGGPHPVLLVRTPYSEPLSRTLPITPAIEAGFAVLVQSCRGTGRSDGEHLRTFEHEASDGLDAIAPTVTPDDYRDGLAYRQGAFQLADRPALADLLPSWHTWLARENDPAYWHGISYAHRRAETAVPALHVGGWFDLFLRGTLNNFLADNYVTLGQHLIVGPWSHADQSGVTGEVFYAGGSAQAIRLEQQQLRFLRESVDGAPSSLPPVQIYVMGADRWRTENEWPLARTDWQTWYRHARRSGHRGQVRPRDPTHLLRRRAAELHPAPRDPIPERGGRPVVNIGINLGFGKLHPDVTDTQMYAEEMKARSLGGARAA